MGQAAAQEAADIIRAAIAANGKASIIIATGNSQLTFLEALRAIDDIDWSKVVIFHMDEYVESAARSSGQLSRLPPAPLARLHHAGRVLSRGRAVRPARGELRDYAALLHEHPVDLCAMGIGENGHIAFNDPPFAEFDDPSGSR